MSLLLYRPAPTIWVYTWSTRTCNTRLKHSPFSHCKICHNIFLYTFIALLRFKFLIVAKPKGVMYMLYPPHLHHWGKIMYKGHRYLKTIYWIGIQIPPGTKHSTPFYLGQGSIKFLYHKVTNEFSVWFLVSILLWCEYKYARHWKYYFIFSYYRTWVIVQKRALI